MILRLNWELLPAIRVRFIGQYNPGNRLSLHLRKFVLDGDKVMAQPLTPAKDTTLELDYEAMDTEVKFSWEPMPDTESYQLLISAKCRFV